MMCCFPLLFMLSISVVANCFTIDKRIDNAALDINKHIITEPTFYHGRKRTEISSTRKATGGHLPSVRLTVPAGGEMLELELELNVDLVPADHALLYQEGGDTITHKPTKEELDYCHYRGSVRGKPNSWAAVSTCRGVSGIIFDGTKVRYIEPAKDGDTQYKHFLYEHGALNKTYYYHIKGVANNDQVYVEPMERQRRETRQSRADRHKKKKGNRGTKQETRYVELVLVADRSMYKRFKGSRPAVHIWMIMLANMMDSIFSPLNIRIVLVGGVVWSELDEARIDEDSFKTLSNFNRYNRKYLIRKISHDHAQLLTDESFLEDNIGRAFTDSICDSEYSVSITSQFSSVLSHMAANSAHELGHSLGVNDHDKKQCFCPDDQCIMDEFNDEGFTEWSHCSKQQLAVALKNGHHDCLLNKPKEALFLY